MPTTTRLATQPNKPRDQLARIALVAHRDATFDRQHDAEAVSRGRQRHDKQMDDEQDCEGKHDRQRDPRCHAQARKRRIVGEKPVAKLKAGKQYARPSCGGITRFAFRQILLQYRKSNQT